MKLPFLTILLSFVVTTVVAQQNYDAGLIPKALLPYASAVVRDQQETIEIKDIENVVYHDKEAITILNKNGDEHARVSIYYDKNNQLKNVKGAIFNEMGILIGKFSEKDFEDVNHNDNMSIFNDGRFKNYSPTVNSYPYTIVFEYDIRQKQSLGLPSWEPNPDDGVAVESSTFKVICKPDFKIRYREANLQTNATFNVDALGMQNYTWQAKNIKAGKPEPYHPNAENYQSSVKLAPQNFYYDGFTGSFTNWNDLGKWFYDKLLVNRDNVPPETARYVTELTKDITDPKQKARKIYEFMQQKTRYVSVQVGIGGLRPFLASEVDQSNYGDCKALVNYTKALLKLADIDSWYCMVECGSRKVSCLPDFASIDQGNHAILCIPFKNDTTWLECTSQKIPFGYLGDFTDDRTVLACTPQGGKLLHTPKYTAQNNLTSRKANFSISDAGELTGDMNTDFEGTQYEYRDAIISEPYTEQVKMIKEEYAINNMTIEKMEFKQNKTLQPVTTEHIKLKARDYALVIDGRYNFLANSVNRIIHIPKEVRNRQTNVYINRGYTDDDEINYTIPAGYHLEKSSLDFKLDKPFGNFKVSLSLKGNQLTYKRKFQLIDGTYSKESYQDLINFYSAVADADSYNVILVKNN